MYKMKYYQEFTYSYSRIKSIQVENGVDKLFLYSGLTKKKEQSLGTNNRQQISTEFSEMINVPIENALESYLAIPDGEVFIDITKEEFNRLLNLGKNNIEEFLTKLPSPK